jgi:hypothetical protein
MTLEEIFQHVDAGIPYYAIDIVGANFVDERHVCIREG